MSRVGAGPSSSETPTGAPRCPDGRPGLPAIRLPARCSLFDRRDRPGPDSQVRLPARRPRAVRNPWAMVSMMKSNNITWQSNRYPVSLTHMHTLQPLGCDCPPNHSFLLLAPLLATNRTRQPPKPARRPPKQRP